jgi:hypothetical protein
VHPYRAGSSFRPPGIVPFTDNKSVPDRKKPASDSISNDYLSLSRSISKQLAG